MSKKESQKFHKFLADLFGRDSSWILKDSLGMFHLDKIINI